MCERTESGVLMCGLCGVLSPQLSKFDIEIFKQLMIMSTLRGEDGAGIIAVPKKLSKELIVLRSQTTAAELACSYAYIQATKKPITCLVGHARLPTSGSYNIEDVHPHVVGPIIGVHNGTMKKVRDQVVGVNDSDSKMLFQSIADYGLDDTIRRSEGAYALSFIDKRADLLYFLRNSERPLHFATVESLPNTLFWASEANFLHTVLSRRTTEKISHKNLRPDIALLFKCHPDGSSNAGYFDRREIKQTILALPPPSVPVVPSYSYARTEDHKPHQLYVTTPQNYISFPALCDLLKSGCQWCESPSTFKDYLAKKISWIDKNAYICSECTDFDDDARNYAISCGCTFPTVN